jgi:hypothetical protein
MMMKAVHDQARYDRVWSEHVAPMSGAYEMARYDSLCRNEPHCGGEVRRGLVRA